MAEKKLPWALFVAIMILIAGAAISKSGVLMYLPRYLDKIKTFLIHGNSQWPDDFVKVTTGTGQEAYFYKTSLHESQPLIVHLHTWNGDYSQYSKNISNEILKKNWNYIHPDFQGKNNNPKACCSDLVTRDIDEAIDFSIANANVDKNRIYVIGMSGGGMTTLCLFMKSNHKIAAFSAWCPISDLIEWQKETSIRGLQYSDDIIKCTSLDDDWVQEAKKRSPMYMDVPVYKLLYSRLMIYAGNRDGLDGAVPIAHSINFFNKLASSIGSQNLIKKDELKRFNQNSEILKSKEMLGDRKILLSKTAGNISLTIFDGGHEMLEDTVLNLF